MSARSAPRPADRQAARAAGDAPIDDEADLRREVPLGDPPSDHPADPPAGYLAPGFVAPEGFHPPSRRPLFFGGPPSGDPPDYAESDSSDGDEVPPAQAKARAGLKSLSPTPLPEPVSVGGFPNG